MSLYHRTVTRGSGRTMDEGIEHYVPPEYMCYFFLPPCMIIPNNISTDVNQYSSLNNDSIRKILLESLPSINVNISETRNKELSPDSPGYAHWQELTWFIIFASHMSLL